MHPREGKIMNNISDITPSDVRPKIRYCPGCRDLVQACPHFMNEDDVLVDAGMTDREMAAIAIRATSGKGITDVIGRIDPSPEITIKVPGGTASILIFTYPRMNGGETFLIPTHPQAFIEPLRLIYAGEARTFMLKNIQIGRNSQFASRGEVPMEYFPPHPEPGSPINNLKGIDRASPGIAVSLEVQNITDRTVDFHAIMFCENAR
jgi:hypothetical protein